MTVPGATGFIDISFVSCAVDGACGVPGRVLMGSSVPGLLTDSDKKSHCFGGLARAPTSGVYGPKYCCEAPKKGSIVIPFTIALLHNSKAGVGEANFQEIPHVAYKLQCCCCA